MMWVELTTPPFSPVFYLLRECTMNYVFNIPSVRLSPEEKAECSKIMAVGNSILYKFAEVHGYKDNVREFRRRLFKGVINPDDPEAINPKLIPARLLEIILRVRDLEQKIISCYIEMIQKIVIKFSWSKYVTYLDQDDLMLEGIMGLREAIYAYKKLSNNFMTYAYASVTNSIRTKIKSSFNIPLTQRSFHLLAEFFKLQHEMEQQHNSKIPRTAVIEAMGLGPKDEKKLLSTFRKISCASVLSGKDSDFDFFDTMSASNSSFEEIDPDRLASMLKNNKNFSQMHLELAMSVVRGDLTVDEAREKANFFSPQRPQIERCNVVWASAKDPVKFWDAVEKSQLNPIQSELVHNSVSGGQKTLRAISQCYINPKTNNHYSSYAMLVMLRQAWKKIKTNLGKDFFAT